MHQWISSQCQLDINHLLFICQVDLKKGEGFADMFGEIGAVDVVINSAAMSSPAACENFVTIAR